MEKSVSEFETTQPSNAKDLTQTKLLQVKNKKKLAAAVAFTVAIAAV